MERETTLPAIHYDDSLFSDFLDRLEETNDIQDMEIQVHWNESDSTTYDNTEDLIRDTNIPDRLLRFTISLTADEGEMTISADGNRGREAHSLRLSGEREWVYKNLSNITEFADLRKNWFSETFRKIRITYFQVFIFGLMASLIGDYVILYFFPNVYPAPLPTETILFSLGLATSVVLLQFSKQYYPYVVLRRRGTEPFYKKAAVAGSIILGLFSSGLTILGFIWG